jgi:hypothetical protein
MPNQGRAAQTRTWVPGYTKQDGTRVDGYYRGAPSGPGVQPSSQQARVREAMRESKPVTRRKD